MLSMDSSRKTTKGKFTETELEELREIEQARAGLLPASRYLSKREDSIIQAATLRATEGRG